MGSFGASSSGSTSRSQQQSEQESFVAPFQIPFLQQLFGANAGALDATAGAPGAARELSTELGATGNLFLDSLLNPGGANPAIGTLQGAGANPIAAQIQQLLGGGGDDALAGLLDPGDGSPLAGADALTDIAGGGALDALLGPSPALGESLTLLEQAIQSNLQGTAGTIAGEATLAGATGGARQALAVGEAGRDANRDFRTGATQLINQDLTRRSALAPQALNARLQAATTQQEGDLASRGLDVSQILGAAGGLNASGTSDIASLLQLLQTELGAVEAGGGLQLGAEGLQATASGAGLASLESLFNLGIGGFSGGFAPLLAASQVLGSPTVLSRGTSSGSSRGRSDSSSIGFGIAS